MENPTTIIVDSTNWEKIATLKIRWKKHGVNTHNDVITRMFELLEKKNGGSQ